MQDLFNTQKHDPTRYSAKDIEVLEGLEPVRQRPGMYIGGTDEKALHHLAAEVIDNAMDEAVAGYATRIEIHVSHGGFLTVADNGRGIPVDLHPKFKNKSALEIILTKLHAGGKFTSNAYKTSGGLNGVGLSVVNALADTLVIEVAREKNLWRQEYVRGQAKSRLSKIGSASNKRGTKVTFHPDPKIFGDAVTFSPLTLYQMASAKAYLFRGLEVRWSCDKELLTEENSPPPQEKLYFPGGLRDCLSLMLGSNRTVTTSSFSGQAKTPGESTEKLEWAVHWVQDGKRELRSYCNTIPTIEGGTHESGLRNALTKGLKAYGELTSNKKTKLIAAEDIFGSSVALLSIFIEHPQFSGQTKERLANTEVSKWVEQLIRDHFDHWLSENPVRANHLIEWAIERALDRQRHRDSKDILKKSQSRKIRIPGKLADCSKSSSSGTELFIVEGDSAGGSAKQARRRESQAVLALRGKILNVASAGREKLAGNQEISNLIQALGCGTRAKYHSSDLRYEKIIIMTDADVDGAHIASLLMTFFFQELPKLVQDGHLYLALPPLYRLSQGGNILYARDELHRKELLDREFDSRKKVDISRFKGLGEMPPTQLKETTMDPEKRALIRVTLEEDDGATAAIVEQLMGRKPEGRFNYIQNNARYVNDIDI